MGEVISVISGKGGTGKTTVCAAVASCLAAEGSRVLCIDADIGLRNLDIALGMAELPVLAFTEVLEGNFTLMDATAHPELDKLFLLTAPSRAGDRSVSPAAFAMLLHDAREQFDYVLIDSAAGIGDSFRLATDSADRCVIVCTSDPACLRDAACTADLLERQSGRQPRKPEDVLPHEADRGRYYGHRRSAAARPCAGGCGGRSGRRTGHRADLRRRGRRSRGLPANLPPPARRLHPADETLIDEVTI